MWQIKKNQVTQENHSPLLYSERTKHLANLQMCFPLSDVLTVFLLFPPLHLQHTFLLQFTLGQLSTPPACSGNRNVECKALAGSTMWRHFVLSTLVWLPASNLLALFLFFWPGTPLNTRRRHCRGKGGENSLWAPWVRWWATPTVPRSTPGLDLALLSAPRENSKKRLVYEKGSNP